MTIEFEVEDVICIHTGCERLQTLMNRLYEEETFSYIRQLLRSRDFKAIPKIVRQMRVIRTTSPHQIYNSLE